MMSGLVPLGTRKGGADHRRWGLIFVVSMLVASASALPLAWWRGDWFQIVIGLQNGYFAWLSWRVLRRHRLGKQARLWDLELALAALVGSLALLVLALWRLMPLAGLFFGALGSWVAARDAGSLLQHNFSISRRVTDHLLASCLALMGAYGAFFNTQLSRLTGLDWSMEAKMLLPFWLGLPLLMWFVPLWQKRLGAARPQVSPSFFS